MIFYTHPGAAREGTSIMLRSFGATVITLSIFTAATPIAQPLDRVDVIISQPTAPVEIYEFDGHDRESKRWLTPVDSFRVGLRYRNPVLPIGDRVVVTVELGLLKCDLWHEFLEYSLQSGFEELSRGEDEELVFRTYQAGTPYQIDTIQTTFAYVNRVMFKDGEIWKASLEQITEEVQKLEPDFDSSFFNQDNLRGYEGIRHPERPELLTHPTR